MDIHRRRETRWSLLALFLSLALLSFGLGTFVVALNARMTLAQRPVDAFRQQMPKLQNRSELTFHPDDVICKSQPVAGWTALATDVEAYILTLIKQQRAHMKPLGLLVCTIYKNGAPVEDFHLSHWSWRKQR